MRKGLHSCLRSNDAHIKSMQYLMNGGKSQSINLGNGSGFSVKQIIETAKKVTKKTLK